MPSQSISPEETHTVHTILHRAMTTHQVTQASSKIRFKKQIKQIKSKVFIWPFLHQLMSQSAVQKPSLKPQTAGNAGVEAPHSTTQTMKRHTHIQTQIHTHTHCHALTLESLFMSLFGLVRLWFGVGIRCFCFLCFGRVWFSFRDSCLWMGTILR